ncbi:DUF6777 domain-containing protein [Streptomyces smaragdinus]|nr:fibronectin type III domain-containing protein [Streptomyces smaragdinus]
MHISRAMALALTVSLAAGACGVSSADPRSEGAGELWLQPVDDAGPDPWTGSTAIPPAGGSQPPEATAEPPSSVPQPRTVVGSTGGLYGGTQDVASCDVGKQIRFFEANHDKRDAFAEVVGVQPQHVRPFLRSLTTVVLRADTRVTNHGFTDGRATSFQSVLQAGTAVLIDRHGVPRVRCACGNPLTAPGKVRTDAGYRGGAWSSFHPNQVIIVKPAPTVIKNIVIVDVVTNVWIQRPTFSAEPEDDRALSRPTNPDPVSPSPEANSPSPSPTQPPDPPTGLEGEPSGADGIRLSWDAPEDAGGIEGYDVYQRGEPNPVQSTSGTTTSATVTGLRPGEDYTFRVRALDAEGRSSRPSAPVTVTLPGPTQEPAPTEEPTTEEPTTEPTEEPTEPPQEDRTEEPGTVEPQSAPDVPALRKAPPPEPATPDVRSDAGRNPPE